MADYLTTGWVDTRLARVEELTEDATADLRYMLGKLTRMVGTLTLEVQALRRETAACPQPRSPGLRALPGEA